MLSLVPILSMRLPLSTITGFLCAGAPVQSIMLAAVMYLTAPD